MRKITLVDCTNSFGETGCKRLSSALENGEAVGIYIDCIGHTRTIYETSRYVEWLKETYKERLVVDEDACWYTTYYLES